MPSAPETRPHALVTNDDGIESAFLHRLVEALLPHFEVTVAAPAVEQSWTGRSVTRHGEIAVIRDTQHFAGEVAAWSIAGTPTDCVNIALGNLVEATPDIVLSGINIGFNTSETLLLSSGTVAGAIEGVLWELPAMAFSKCVPESAFLEIARNKGKADADFTRSLEAAANHAARMARNIAAAPQAHLGKVINVNFPAPTSAQTTVVDTVPARLRLGSLFAESSPGKYSFRYTHGTEIEPHPKTDRSALAQGYISRSVLDFSKVGQLVEG
jgi:5'-nucleotidase